MTLTFAGRVKVEISVTVGVDHARRLIPVFPTAACAPALSFSDIQHCHHAKKHFA
jgi:hypothetical protein